MTVVILPKSSQHSSEFPIVCLTLDGWIQSSAMIKQQDVRWCGFRWSIPLLFDYVWNWVLIGLSRLLHAHIAYEIDIAKIIAAFIRISHFFHDLICLNSVACHVETTRCTMMRISLIDSAINWQCLEFVYWYRYLDFFMLVFAYEIDIAKIIAASFRISSCLHDLILSNSIARRVQTTRCTMVRFSLIVSDINWLCFKCLCW